MSSALAGRAQAVERRIVSRDYRRVPLVGSGRPRETGIIDLPSDSVTGRLHAVRAPPWPRPAGQGYVPGW